MHQNKYRLLYTTSNSIFLFDSIGFTLPGLKLDTTSVCHFNMHRVEVMLGKNTIVNVVCAKLLMRELLIELEAVLGSYPDLIPSG